MRLENIFKTIKSNLYHIPTLSPAQSPECHIQSFLGHFHHLPGIFQHKKFCVSLSLLLHLLLQTNLDRAHSCQHEPQLYLPLTPHTRKNLQKTEFASKPAPSRKCFSTHLTRKGVFSFFGNTWALPLSKLSTAPSCNVLYPLHAMFSIH